MGRTPEQIIADMMALQSGGQQAPSQPQSPMFQGLPLKQASVGGMTFGKDTSQTEKEIEKQQATSSLANNEMMGLLGNLTSNLKSANIEQGGAGLVKGLVGNAATALKLDNTGNIKGLQGTVRDTAIKMAQRLSGGNRGATLIFQKVLETVPTNLENENQQASTINDMAHTAISLEKAARTLGTDAISKMKPDELRNYIKTNSLTPDEDGAITQQVAEMIRNSKPRESLDMAGNVSQPKINSLSGLFFHNGNLLGNTPSGISYTVRKKSG